MQKGTKLINILIVVEIILTMTLYYFVYIGFSAVTYAIDTIKTNNNNVNFSAYFINENGEKVEKIDKDINSIDEYLYIDISVSNDGYFNGTIKFENANFNLKEQDISSNIDKISENEIQLNQINAGTKETIKIAIESIKKENMSNKELNCKTDVILFGKYINSKNVEKDKYIEINGTSTIEINWISSHNSEIELNSEVLTNSIYSLNNEDKRVIQLLINCNLKNNEYPINKSIISLKVPQKIEKVEVFARNTDSTNFNQNFNSENYIYDRYNNLLTITVLNDDVEKICWRKDSKDSFVVTYILDKDEDIENLVSNVRCEMLLYDQKQLVLNEDVKLNEQIDKIISNDLKASETSIYKGKIYTAEEREYNVTSYINVNFSDIVEKINVKEEEAKFISNGNEINANIIYKSTVINKQNFLTLFGEEGFITISDENGNIIANINNSTNTDENGNIVVKYVGELKSLIFDMSKPINVGVLQLNNIKSILNTGLTKDEIINLNGIKEKVTSNYNDNNYFVNSERTIELKNTSSKATFNINTDNLISIEKNENVKMEIILENTDESRDLYQNPTIKIRFPKQVTDISAKCKLMYGNGLDLGNATIYKDEENYIIEIDLIGIQSSYNKNILEGTTIIVYADITLDKMIENSDEEINLSYTNELASSYEDNGEIKKSIKIDGLDKETIQKLQEEAKVNSLAETNQNNQIKSTLKAYVGGKEIKNGDTVYTGEIIKYELTVENIGNQNLNNINITANIPENEKYVKYIKNTESTEDENGTYAAEDYYEQVEAVDNKIINNIETLEPGRKITNIYELKIDEQSENGDVLLNININSAEYNNQISLNNHVEVAEAKINMYMVGRTNQELKTRTTYTYKIEVENLKDTDISNLNIQIENNPAITLVDTYVVTNNYQYQKIETSNELHIENLEKNGKAIYYIDVEINDSEDYSKISAKVNNRYRSNVIEEGLLKYIIEASLSSDSEGQQLNQGEKINYSLNVKNTGNTQVDNVIINQSISKYLDVKKVIINNETVDFDVFYEYDDVDKILSETDENEIMDATEFNNYIIEYYYNKPFNINDELKITIETEIKTPENGEFLSENTTIESLAKINAGNEIKTERVQHIINSSDNLFFNPEENEKEEFDNQDDSSNNNENENTNNDQNQNNNNTDNKDNSSKNEEEPSIYSISGTIWLDKNENGKRDSGEENINEVKVKLLELESGDIENTTVNNGTYIFNNINQGKYIVIFEYDTDKYMLTKYKTNDSQENRNSDVEQVTLTLNGKEQNVFATDTLEVRDKNITNIDLGLIEAKKFDLELSKTISKVTISNQNGNTVKEYNNEKLAKAEIAAKYLKGSTIIIEYNIKIKNTGELAGYVKQIVDYLPKDLYFNSTLNQDWYQSGEYVYSNSLANKKLEAGKEEELKLIVTKQMTESNTGLVNNIAEIKMVANSQNIEDIDSSPGNKQSNEDDIGSCNVIISVKTGAAINYFIITISIIIMILICSYMISKKILKNNNI